MNIPPKKLDFIFVDLGGVVSFLEFRRPGTMNIERYCLCCNTLDIEDEYYCVCICNC